MSYAEKAVDFFVNGYNCAQATAAAFADEIGIDEKEILKVMAGFGGGVGGQREMCGAVAGMVYVLGARHGGYDPKDNDAKTKLYEAVRRANDEFRAKFGTTTCKDLLLNAGCLPKPEPSVRNAEYYVKRPCAHFVASAAEIISEAHAD